MSEFLDDLLSNRNFGAMSRDDEAERVRRAILPVDLRKEAKENWPSLLHRDVVLPEKVINYLDGRALSDEESDMLEKEVAAFHDVQPPFQIVCSPKMQRTGKAWIHLPEASAFLTGFYLDQE